MPTAWNTSTKPIAMHLDTTDGTADTWVAYTPPTWVRVIEVQNRSAVTAIRVGNPGRPEGTFAGTDDHVVIAAGESHSFPWTSGRARSKDAAGGVPRTIVISSAGMSIPFTLSARQSEAV